MYIHINEQTVNENRKKTINKSRFCVGHLGVRAFFVAFFVSHGVYRYCPNVNDDPALPEAVFAGVSSLPPDEEQVVDGRRTAFCANVLNSNNFVPPPKLPARANAANPPPLATVCSGLESTD